MRVLVLGGTGYIGSYITTKLVSQKIDVTAFSRNKKVVPDKVEKISGDALSSSDIRNAMSNQYDSVISCLGSFGSNSQMQRICGDANIMAAQYAFENKVNRFVFVSEASVGMQFPRWFPMYGYFDGKRRAEVEIARLFKGKGVSLRPGFVYGNRNVAGVVVPLQWIGIPWFHVATSYARPLLASIPFIGTELISPVSVESVANAAVFCATNDFPKPIMTAQEIMSFQ